MRRMSRDEGLSVSEGVSERVREMMCSIVER